MALESLLLSFNLDERTEDSSKWIFVVKRRITQPQLLAPS